MSQTYYGDCRQTLSSLAGRGERVQMCVTSPPYFGLRDYGHPGQLGLEKTPSEYVRELVAVLSQVKELLAADGTLWLNLGDSYARTGGTDRKVSPSARVGSTRNTLIQMGDRHSNASDIGLKHKDLIGIPWRVAFALQDAGWYLRQDIIWHKSNPMPESVTDRCTKAHEYLFLLSKNDRYFFDHEAIQDVAVGPSQSGKRNKRSVWTVPTNPYKGAHFSVFPEKLIEPCILAGSRPGDTVLDPFMGSGTTAEVAEKLNRKWIGCEINQGYAGLQSARLANLDGLHGAAA